MNRFDKFFNKSMSEYEATLVYYSLMDGLSKEEIAELEKAFAPIAENAMLREMRIAYETQTMMGC